MKLTDEAVEALSESLIGAAWATFDEGLLNTLRAIHRSALEAALPHLEGATPALLDSQAVENAIATKVMYYDSGTAVHEVDDGDLAGLVAGVDAVMALARPIPTYSELKAAIRTGLGGDHEEGCGCESHVCSAADAVLALIEGAS